MPKIDGSPASSPRQIIHFFKIFLPNLSSKHLKIPPAFHPHVEGEAPARFYLKGPSDYVWGVDLIKRADGLFFADGWEKFVFDHSLAAGDFLLFKYNGSSTLSVVVFDNTACEKEGAFIARPTSDEKFAVTLDLRVKEEENKEKTVVCMNQSVKRNAALTMTSERLISLSMASTGSEHFRSSSDLIDNEFDCSNDVNFFLESSQTKVDGPRKRVARGFLSQRRPTTQEERDDALARAQSFRSNKPFFMMVMKGSYVYHGFYLFLPVSFPHKYLPCCSGPLFLHDPSKRHWTVNFLYSRRPALSGGWGKFAVSNNLEADDVCVFELISKSHMKVHFFRVVDDVKPLLRVSSIKNMISGENFKALIDSP
ncbi:B3 domain-containing protein [Platanthera guangdongensis]|uniref:B3 domain-containing protein n=1 Tax=Platanthera guangdongensis TaxID=2320717 RepID=A0ABR2LPS9_9ASPA